MVNALLVHTLSGRNVIWGKHRVCACICVCVRVRMRVVPTFSAFLPLYQLAWFVHSPCASGPLFLLMLSPGKPYPFLSFSEQSSNEGTRKSSSSPNSGIGMQGNIGQNTWPLRTSIPDVWREIFIDANWTHLDSGTTCRNDPPCWVAGRMKWYSRSESSSFLDSCPSSVLRPEPSERLHPTVTALLSFVTYLALSYVANLWSALSTLLVHKLFFCSFKSFQCLVWWLSHNWFSLCGLTA